MAADHDGIEYDESANDYVGFQVVLVGDGLTIEGEVLAARGAEPNNPFAGEIDLLWWPGKAVHGCQLGAPQVLTFAMAYVAVHDRWRA